MKKLTDYISEYKTIAVAGMCKNAGKTTVVNHIVESWRNQYKIGLTSIGYDGEDVDEVMDIIKEVDDVLRNDDEFASLILEPIEIMGLDKFADSALIIKARTKTKPMKQWQVAREFNRRLKKIFDERGVEIPFPHLTLYAGQDKAGKAAPIHIVTEKNENL